MPHAPIDQRPTGLRTNTRQGMWDRMRELRIFEIAEICGGAKHAKTDARKYVMSLCHAGICYYKSDSSPRKFVLKRDMGKDYPRIRKDGSVVGLDRGQLNMWRAMRGLDCFNAQDIAAHATTDETSVKLQTAKSYIKHLLAAGYLRIIKKAKGGKTGNLAIYKLVRNTGPFAPKIQRVKQVYDMNIEKVTYCPHHHEERAL